MNWNEMNEEKMKKKNKFEKMKNIWIVHDDREMIINS